MASMTIEEAYDDYLRRQAVRRENEIEKAYRDYQRRQDEKDVSEGINGLSQFVSDTYHSGLGGIQTGMANMNDALAHGVRSLPFMSGVADWIGEGADWWDAKARANAQKVKNHNLWTSSINALGSTAPSMASSLALAATGNIASAGRMLMPAGLMDLSQKTLSGAMMYRSGEEALGNAGRTYREAIHEGRTPEQAQSQANRQLAAELPMNVFFDKAGIFGDAWEGIQNPVKRGLLMTAGEVLGQGGQEVGQDVIGDAAAATRDQGVPEYLRAIGENVTNAEYLKQEMKDTFLPTGLSSLIGAALGLGVRSMRNKRGSNVDNFARGVPDTGTQQAIAEIMQPVEEERRRKKLDDWIPESQGIVPGNVAPQTPQKMSDMFKPAEPQPVIPESAKPLPGAVPETEAPVQSGKKAESVMAANVQKIAEMQATIETPEATTQSIAETPEPVELQPVPSVQEEVGEDTGETLDDLRAQMAEEYQNVQRMDTEEREDLPPAATDSTFAKAAKTPAPKKTYRAGNSSTSGNRQNAVLNVSTGVITISDGNPKPNKKDNRSSYTVTLRELDDIYNSPYIYNKEAALYKMVKEREYAAAEKWIEGSANEKLKRRRREIWENSTIYGKYSALTGHVIYDQIAALKSVYEKYNKNNPNRKMERSTRQPGNPLFIERAETNMPQTQQSVPASTLSRLMKPSGRHYEQSPNVQNVIGRAPAKNKRRSFELGADVESALQALGEIHMANSGRDMMVKDNTSAAGNVQTLPISAEDAAAAHRVQAAFARKLKNAGRDTRQAVMEAKLLTSYLERRVRDARAEGRRTSIEQEARRLDVRFGTSEARQEGNVLNQAMRAGINLDERIPVVDLSGAADRAKGMNWRGLLRHLKSQIGQGPSISRDALAFLKMPANPGKLHHIAYSGAQVFAKEKPIRNASVLSLPELMRNAIYVEEAPNTKMDKKPDVLKYHRFYVPVMINGKVSTIRIVAEEKKTSDKLFPIDVDAYDVIVESKRTPSPKGNNAQLMRRESSLHEITIRDMLRGVKGMDGQKYAQSAWHGSPHRFESFDLGAVGSGEGAQAHGWGLYFARDKKIAEGYKDKLSLFRHGHGLNMGMVESYRKQYAEGTPEREAVDGLAEDFRMWGGMDPERAEGAYEATINDIAARKQQAEREIERLEDFLEDEDEADYPEKAAQLRDFKKELTQIELEERIAEEIFSDYGSLLEVDVPENDVLLDEDLQLPEQPEKVREAISRYYRSRPDDYIAVDSDSLPEQNGRLFLKEVIRQLAREGEPEPRKAASLLLNSLGIKGITYDGRQDGRCFVVFDDKAISVINRYNQQAAKQGEALRGQIAFAGDRSIVTLFENADASTFIHETGHFILRNLIADGTAEDASARAKADLAVVRGYLGLSDADVTALAGNAPADGRLREKHEYFARTWEAYLMTGKAPNKGLRGLFERFKRELLRIYADIKALGVKPTAEINALFDRLLGKENTPENGDFGPIWRGYRDEAAVEKLLKERQGEVAGAMSDSRLGENSSIDFVWGQEGDPQREYSGGYGLAHVKAKHGIEMARNVPRIIRSGRISFETNDRVYFGSPQGRVVLKQQWKDNAKNWVLTSYVPKDTKKVPRSAQDPETGGRTEESLSSSDGKPFDSRIPQSSNESNRDFSVHGGLPQVKVTAAPGSKSAGTLIRVKDIYDKLRAIAPVRKGVSAPANVAGYYTPLTGVARERHWGDFSTALHEIGHALDYKLGLRESVRDAETSRQLYDELCELGKATSPQNVTTLYEKLHGRYMNAPGAETHGPDVSAAALKFGGAQRYLMKEGIAEYFRGYAFNPDLMEVVAPEYTKMFREALEAHEEYQQPVSELFDAVRSYSELTPEQKLRAGMIRGDEKVKNQKGARAAVAEAWNGFRQKFDDQLRYLEQMQNLLRDRVRELAKEHGGRYADMLQHGELKDEFAVYDMLRTMPGYMGKAKRDVLALLEPVKKIGDEAYDALTSYMKAMRALDYWENGLEPGIGLTRAETTAIVNRTRHENPELVRIVETIAKAYETMVERTLIDSGVWSREQYEEYKKRWPHYVPFVRVNEDGSVTAPTSRGRGVVNLSNQVKRATGVGAEDAVIDIKDPFETMIKNALVFNQLAEKNRAGRALVNAALADPAIFAGLIEPVRGGERSRDTFTVWIDGKRMAFTGDKKLLDALASMEQAAGIGNPIFGTLDRAAQGAANLLKLGATRANPAFILVNFMRDAMYSSLTNGAKGARSMPFFGTVKGLLMQTAKDEASKQRIVDALDHGLAYSGITELGLNVSEKGISKYVGKAVHGDKSFLKKLASAWDSTIGKYNEMIELAPKFAEYERLVKEGYPKRYAARMAREVNLDFSRGGQWGKVWNRYTAFFNPAVQGTSKLVRTAAAHPGRFAARTAMYVILPSLISWMAGRDDDEYKRISRNIKDRYWVFKIGGTWLRLPKPELVGMFGSAVERVLDSAFEHDPMAFRELGRSVWEGFSPNLLPTFIEPILEHRMGKTFFYDSPLIPPQLENLPPELQFTKNTSSMAKFLGKAWGVSPILIDHYVSSYGGGVGEYLSKTPDILLKPQEEAKKLSEKPLFSRFTVDPNRNSESLTKFYNLRKQATTAKNAYDVRRKMGEQPEYSAGVHMAKAFDQSARKLSDWRKNIAAYQQSKTLTPERKREIIDRIRLRMNQEAETAVKNYFTVKEKLDQRKR